MRICYIFNSSVPSSNPGSLQVIKTCEGLIKHNNEVELITPNTGQKLSIKKFYNLKKIPKISKIKFFKKFPLGLNYYLFSFFAVTYVLRSKFDLVITRNFFTLFLLTILNKKVIIEVHHDLSIESRIVRFIYYTFNIFNSSSIVKIIAITNNVKKYLIEDFKITSDKIEIIPSATDLKFVFSNLKNKNYLKIGYFGSLERGKGADFVCKLSKLDKKNQYFIYGGSGGTVLSLKKIYKNINLKIYSYKPYSHLTELISNMDVLLIPSDKNIVSATGGVGNLSNFTSPLKLFDYLASGKLIISSNLNVLKEILRNNFNCIMIKDLSLINWHNEINRIKQNLTRVNHIKKNSFSSSKKYTYYKRAESILKNININT